MAPQRVFKTPMEPYDVACENRTEFLGVITDTGHIVRTAVQREDFVRIVLVGQSALQKIALSPVVVIAEGYATAASIAKHGKVPAIAAFDSGNLAAVAIAHRERHKDKQIIIAGDDDHRLEHNPGHAKALEATAAVKGLAVFPKLSAEQREQGLTDFNDVARQDPELITRQFEDVIRRGREQSPTQAIELAHTI
jgi:phage/plasmid primase-like uncharacterized protein